MIDLKEYFLKPNKEKSPKEVEKIEDTKNCSELICPFFTNKKTLCYTSQCMAWESTGKDTTIGFCKRLK